MSTISITRTTTAFSTLITSSDNKTASTTESAFRELEWQAEARIGNTNYDFSHFAAFVVSGLSTPFIISFLFGSMPSLYIFP
jgi:hypothetical protein